MHLTPQLSADTVSMAKGRDLLLRGLLDEGLAVLAPASQSGDDIATFMLAQVLAFQGDWTQVRSLCQRLLKKPFAFDPFVNGQDLMKLFALSAIVLDDWKEAKKVLRLCARI